MKIAENVLRLLAITVAFSCCLIPLSYCANETALSSRQKFISIVNLEGESSANTVVQNNGVVEFQGNELVDSVAEQMASNGTLPPDSTLVLPRDGRDTTHDAETASTPLALVEKDLQGEPGSKGTGFDAITRDAAIIARGPTRISPNQIFHASNPISDPGSDLGLGKEEPGGPVGLGGSGNSLTTLGPGTEEFGDLGSNRGEANMWAEEMWYEEPDEPVDSPILETGAPQGRPSSGIEENPDTGIGGSEDLGPGLEAGVSRTVVGQKTIGSESNPGTGNTSEPSGIPLDDLFHASSPDTTPGSNPNLVVNTGSLVTRGDLMPTVRSTSLVEQVKGEGVGKFGRDAAIVD